MKMAVLIVAVMAPMLLVSPVRAQEDPAPESKDPTEQSARKIKGLQKERIAVLKKLSEQLASLYKNGRVDYGEMLEAARQLAEAELEAAETDKERLELYQNLVTLLKQYESWTVAQFQAARGAEASVLKARSQRLAAEIQLEKMKIKVAKAAK
jgi:hypothetical protein